MLKSFVGVRVAEIQASLDPAAWRYVPTNLNSPDDLSRDIPLCEMHMNGRWTNGPSFLTQDSDQWPTDTHQVTPEIAEIPEVKVNKSLLVLQPTVINLLIDPSRFSS